MKLLIVDDEELTRTGLISAIDWKSLGIDQIIQATTVFTVWNRPVFTNPKSFCVMYVCLA